MADTRVQLRNPVKGKTGRDVDRAKYELVRKELLAVVPTHPPGIALTDLKTRMVERVGKRLRPGSHDWWTMAVKLDLEAAGELKRVGAAPQRLVRAR
jgi:hypothetical protein